MNDTMIYPSSINADFSMLATGDCMTGARIHDGDIVYFKKQSQVENGEIAAVLVNGTPYLKRFFSFPEKSMIILKTENPKYPDMVFFGEELDGIQILGKAIGFSSIIQ